MATRTSTTKTPVKATATKAATTRTRRRPTPKASTSGHQLLLAAIPEMIVYDDYQQRELPGGWIDIDLMRYAKETKQNVLLTGDTGAGKSMMVRAYCAVDQIPLVTIPCNGAIEPSQLFGMPLPGPDGSIYFQESGLVHVCRNGGVIFLDEVNAMPPRVAMVLHQMLRERYIILLEKGGEIVHLSPDTQVIGSMNEDYIGTRPLNPAFRNRFALKVNFEYDPEVEKQLTCMPVMLDMASRLRARFHEGDIETPISTNMLIEFETIAIDLGYDFAIGNLLNAFSKHEHAAVQKVIELFSKTIKEQLEEMK